MNIKRMEVMIGDLSESFDRHVTLTQETYHFVLPCENGTGKLLFRVYSKGGNAQLEILAFALSDDVNFEVKVDGEIVDERMGAITIAPLALARGWRNIEIIGKGVSTGKVRISGSISNASILQ